MQNFKNITNNDALAACIRELTYDTRLFWCSDVEQESAPYIEALHNGYGPDEYEPNFDSNNDDHRHEWYRSGNIVQYDELYGKQQQILEARHDFEVLSTGLSQLPNLQTVSMIGVKDACVGHHSNTDQNCTGYEAWCKRFWPTIVPPWTSHRAAACGFKQPWDLRGIKSLVEAISLHTPSITRFYYGTQLYPEESLPDIVSSHIRNLAPNLTRLEIYCKKLPKPRSTPLHQSNFADIIRNTPNLQHLALGEFLDKCYSRSCEKEFGNICLCNRGWEELFLSNKWARLSSLSIDLCGSGIKRAICFANRQTLREVSFVGCIFLSQDYEKAPEFTPTTWAVLGEELSQFLKLHFLGVWTSSGFREGIDELSLQSFCSSFMQKAPYDLRITDSEELGTQSVEMWSRP